MSIAVTNNMVEDTKENSAKCFCKSCPSKNTCMDNDKDLLYCAKGKTSCEVEKRGCVCGACPITYKYNLTGHYFCQNGIDS